jgi:hypothetical protein
MRRLHGGIKASASSRSLIHNCLVSPLLAQHARGWKPDGGKAMIGIELELAREHVSKSGRLVADQRELIERE